MHDDVIGGTATNMLRNDGSAGYPVMHACALQCCTVKRIYTLSREPLHWVFIIVIIIIIIIIVKQGVYTHLYFAIT